MTFDFGDEWKHFYGDVGKVFISLSYYVANKVVKIWISKWTNKFKGICKQSYNNWSKFGQFQTSHKFQLESFWQKKSFREIREEKRKSQSQKKPELIKRPNKKKSNAFFCVHKQNNMNMNLRNLEKVAAEEIKNEFLCFFFFVKGNKKKANNKNKK